VLVDAEGGGERRGPFLVGGRILGWRDAQHLVTASFTNVPYGHHWRGVVWENSMTDGSSRTLSLFEPVQRCSFSLRSECEVTSIVEAPGLLSELEVVSAQEPQRGRPWWQVVLSAGLLCIALVTAIGMAITRHIANRHHP
jgi:hypothetical protein